MAWLGSVRVVWSGAVGAEDDGGRHRQGVGAVSVDAGQVEPQLQLSGTGLLRRPGQDAGAASDDIAGVETAVKVRCRSSAAWSVTRRASAG